MANILKKISLFLDNTYTKILLGAACVFCLVILFMQRNTRKQFDEVSKLPFHETQVEQVMDGTYDAAIYTSFLRITAKVTVENHKITNIEIVDQKGAAEGELEGYAQEMIAANTSVIHFGNKDDIMFNKLVFISCIDTALYKGVPEEDKNKNSTENTTDASDTLNEVSPKTE